MGFLSCCEDAAARLGAIRIVVFNVLWGDTAAGL
jgi:hypothetical protein